MTDAFSMDRRALVSRIAMLIGASALPAGALAAPAKRAKCFLPPSQFKLMAAVADTLIPTTDTPGALATKVPQSFDSLVVNWASPETRTAISAALVAIDKAAMETEKASFVALTPDKRKAVLAAHDKAALKPVPRKDKLTGLAALLGAPAVADPGYSSLKELLVNLYYATEVALTQEIIYEHAPGKWVASLKITPGMRPFGTPGMF